MTDGAAGAACVCPTNGFSAVLLDFFCFGCRDFNLSLLREKNGTGVKDKKRQPFGNKGSNELGTYKYEK